MPKFLLPALIAGLATSFAGLATSAIAQSDAAPRRFAVTGFDAIDLSGSDSIRVLPGATLSVIADGDPRAVAALAIDVRDGTLRVGRKPGNWRDQGARITVTLPRLRAARISGSGDIRVGAVAGRDFTGSISGSGTLAVTDLDAETARFALPGSGTITAAGRATQVAIALDGSGRIDTRALATPVVRVTMGGAGTIAATATRTADIAASGSGSIRVAGGATCAVRNSGAASVRCG